MSRILIGWEIGSGQGHVTRIVRHRIALEAAGHEVVVALRRRADEVPDAIPAPIWGHPPMARVPTVSLGDVLINLGAAVPGAFRATVEGWTRTIDAVRPTHVIADFAPALLVAARGRATTLLIGNGYDCPPSDMPTFPSLVIGRTPHDERIATEAMGLPTMPSAFAADHVVVGALPWIDPYGHLRPGVHLPPAAEADVGGEGRGVFAYVVKGHTPAVDEALDLCGLPVRRYVPGKPTPWREIAAENSIVVSHGGCGFVTQAALCGMPQIVIMPDLEKLIYGYAVSRLGIGKALPAPVSDAAGLAKTIASMAGDDGLRRECRRQAERFRVVGAAEPVATIVELCGR